MYQAIEAVCRRGVVHPLEPVDFKENERLILIRLPLSAPPPAHHQGAGFQSLFGILKSDTHISFSDMEAAIAAHSREALGDRD